MNKKIAGIGLCILLASTVCYADPFDDKSVSVNNSASNDSLETADISVKEDNSGSSGVSSDTKDIENWILNGNEKSENKEESPKAEETAEEKTEETTESKTSEYTVVSGDCLSAIAGRLLGDMSRWPEIVELNKDKYPSLVSNPNLIYVGWNLIIPGTNGTTKDTNTKDTNTKDTNNSTVVADNNNSTSGNNNTNTDNSNTAGTSENTSSNSSRNTDGPIITSDSRVLHIGDSHSMGIYGQTIDGLMRETGATVKTEAFGGANPQWFMNGQLGVCGSYSKDENGKVSTTGNNQRNTPLLSDMLSSYKPSVLVVSLGANMVGYNESTQRSMITSLLDQAKAAGCQIVWVGPPDSRKLSDSSCDKLYKVLESELPKYNGVLVDSRKYTKYPDGGDGIHYWGTEGVAQAKNWANEAMNVIQGK